MLNKPGPASRADASAVMPIYSYSFLQYTFHSIVCALVATEDYHAGVAINTKQWGGSKSLCKLPGVLRVTVESFRCVGCRERGREHVPPIPKHKLTDLSLQAYENSSQPAWWSQSQT